MERDLVHVKLRIPRSLSATLSFWATKSGMSKSLVTGFILDTGVGVIQSRALNTDDFVKLVSDWKEDNIESEAP